MATPPPEAPSVLKEEKPQLPPSPNGDTSSDIGRAGVPPSVTEIKSTPPTNGTEPLDKGSNEIATNGHASGQQNGTVTTASPPKSPAPLAPDVATSQDRSSNMSTELKPGSLEDKPVSTGDAPTQPTNGTDAPTAVDAQSQHSSNSVKTELPHHPPTVAQPEMVSSTATPVAKPQSSEDQEMRDAPNAPSPAAKLSREREAEPDDEPSAKRTKFGTEGEAEFKVPEAPTPASEGQVDIAPSDHMTMTDVQQKFILKMLTGLKRLSMAKFYKEPVDPDKLNVPLYPEIIKQPMDLGTIERKLRTHVYKRPHEVSDDVRLMVRNALTFNGPVHVVTTEGQKLEAYFLKSMENLPKPTEVEEKKPKKLPPATSAARREPRTSIGQPTPRATAASPQATTFALTPDGFPIIRRDSTNADGRPKRSIHPPKRDLPYSTKPKKKKYQWELKFCQEVLDELHKPKHYLYALPFHQPVDPVALNIPTYHSIIKKPMDLSTVQSKLNTGQYENAKDFEADIRQIVRNCLKFNLRGDPTYMAGEKFEEVFNEKWSQKDRYLTAHEPHPEQQSAESSSEESDEDDEGSDDEAEEAINRLRKQISDMSQQLEVLTQKKKKTPSASKKSKPKKKDVKKNTFTGTGKKDKKSASKASKPEKQRWVSYHEKQVISNGISSLPDKKMQEALRIIQTNVPSLKGTQEAEIELDIDELPNDVLLMLLKFVKKNAPHVVDDEDLSTPSAPNAPPPKPKKNKPMSKYEQEAQINMLESNLSRFQGGIGGHSPDPVLSVEANDSSGDSEDSEESEEE
ncbi:Bromodomain-containing protein [Aspergillus californicus]